MRKFYLLAIALLMLGATPAMAEDFTDTITVNVNGVVTGQTATISVTPGTDGTSTFVLKNFVLKAGGQSLGVGFLVPSIGRILPAAGIECDKCLCHSCYQLTDAKIGVFAKCPVIDFSQEIIEIPEIETTGFPGKGQFCLPGLRIMKTTAPTQTAMPIPIFSVIGSPKRSVPIRSAVNGSKTPRMEVFVGPI